MGVVCEFPLTFVGAVNLVGSIMRTFFSEFSNFVLQHMRWALAVLSGGEVVLTVFLTFSLMFRFLYLVWSS